MIKKKLLKNSVAVTLAAFMVLGSSSTALALQDGQANDYTQETIENGGGVGYVETTNMPIQLLASAIWLVEITDV